MVSHQKNSNYIFLKPDLIIMESVCSLYPEFTKHLPDKPYQTNLPDILLLILSFANGKIQLLR